MTVEPSPLVDDISASPGMAARCCSSGVATELAMVSGLAPGRFADTTMVGKSTLGSAATGSSSNVARPNTRMPAINSAVAIGRRMKIAEMLNAASARVRVGGRGGGFDPHLGVVGQPVLPVDTTLSPAASPSAMTAIPSCRLATCTSRRCTVSPGRIT